MSIRIQSQQCQARSSICISSSPRLAKSAFRTFYKKPRDPRFESLRCQSPSTSTAVVGNASDQTENGSPGTNVIKRKVVRLGLPSKGRMSANALELLKSCQLAVRQDNPRQYVADIPGLPNLEVWFQRENDIVRKLLSGDLDLGIVGYDTVCEFGQDTLVLAATVILISYHYDGSCRFESRHALALQHARPCSRLRLRDQQTAIIARMSQKDDEDLILVHEALNYGDCHLSIAIPTYGIFENIASIEQLEAMPQWTVDRPLRIATGFTYLGPKFVKEKGLKHVQFSTADGALEVAPTMGIADAILDLVSSGTTLRENNLKEIKGGTVLESQAVFIASKKALLQGNNVLETTHEMLERLEAHLRADGQFKVVANMRGRSAEEVAKSIREETEFSGLQGPTVSPVFCKGDREVKPDYYAIAICVPKKQLYDSVRQLRKIGGSGVLVSPLTYIFDEEPPRWRKLLDQLNL